MSNPFDATMKDLGADYPYDFLATFDRTTTEPIRQINVDLSTITTAADVVIGLGEPLCEVVHIDFQASADKNKGADVLVYNGLLYRQYRVPVHSVLVLLRPQASHSEVSGSIAYAARPGRGNMEFGERQGSISPRQCLASEVGWPGSAGIWPACLAAPGKGQMPALPGMCCSSRKAVLFWWDSWLDLPG